MKNVVDFNVDKVVAVQDMMDAELQVEQMESLLALNHYERALLFEMLENSNAKRKLERKNSRIINENLSDKSE